MSYWYNQCMPKFQLSLPEFIIFKCKKIYIIGRQVYSKMVVAVQTNTYLFSHYLLLIKKENK